MYELWEGLKRAKEYKWVELSHPLDNDSPFWAGIPEGSVELCKTVYDWGNPMLDCLIPVSSAPTSTSPATLTKKASPPRPTAWSSWSSLCASLTCPTRWPRMCTMR